ncbi:MAG: hypothetical protein IT424_04380 [Pirellulales bacterium]|nr:hypothetical protein [Pirellulales bacterium]
MEFDSNTDYTLAETNGPWLIMAASFTGEGGESEARNLVAELRSKFNLPAFYYGMTFTLDERDLGRGIDDYGAPIRRRYKRGSQVVEHAVLIGEFPHIDDPEAQNLLERVKTLQPECLKVEAGEATSQSLIDVRQFQKSLNQRLGKPAARGPMGHAFLTRNPLLPKEYFTPPGVDAEVAKWNKGVKYSLLDCPGKYTIQVATFTGRTMLKAANDGVPDNLSPRAMTAKDPLVVAAENANKLTIALREKGWEAYEFHDRHESIVTVGSFNEMQRFDDGRLLPATPDAQIIINTFSAATPTQAFDAAVYREMGVKEDQIRKLQAEEMEIKQQFDSRFSKGMGDIADGFNPKRLVGVPFDIQPRPIEAPKQSISSAYVRR